MSDLFHEDVPLSFVQQVFDVIQSTPQHTYQILTKRSKRLRRLASDLPWPPNLWIGVSVETARYTFRIEDLRHVPAAIRFISAEPLLSDVGTLDLTGIHWVIAGGESGPAARAVRYEWIASLRDQCAAHDIAFFFKQWGGRTPKAQGREIDGETWDELPSQIAS